jgi:hypothetical protein
MSPITRARNHASRAAATAHFGPSAVLDIRGAATTLDRPGTGISIGEHQDQVELEPPISSELARSDRHFRCDANAKSDDIRPAAS